MHTKRSNALVFFWHPFHPTSYFVANIIQNTIILSRKNIISCDKIKWIISDSKDSTKALKIIL